MTLPGEVSRIVTTLVKAGFVSVGGSYDVSGVPFSFDTVLVGGEKSLDLVLVIGAEMSGERLPQRVAALCRALDYVGSRRSVTVITAGWKIDRKSEDALAMNARVLQVPAGATAAEIRRSVLVLLPIDMPSARDGGEDARADLIRALGTNSKVLEEAGMIPLGQVSPSSVRDQLQEWLTEPYDGTSR